MIHDSFINWETVPKDQILFNNLFIYFDFSPPKNLFDFPIMVLRSLVCQLEGQADPLVRLQPLHAFNKETWNTGWIFQFSGKDNL